ncbi:CvpA family protein [Neisseria animalis]|uniref:CvpA family protein n=1 Tax=Neisseria animalis TaxID=492 RepID=A0A5P3MP38_NEIAN|nr:CvpA family protein [Neisseria animalis]QEY23296.1 CvpA family protein [Neisseria animalis]ROW31950.1 CvpA family protein [Neisseria animalis]VEE08611.1 bacteriocin production protein [Neisseria animalis]
MSNIPLADILALAVIVSCFFISMSRGVIAEAGSLITWIAAFFAAKTFAVQFADIAFQTMQPRALAVALSFVMVFIAIRVALYLIRSLLTSAVSALGLGSVNRLLGGIFGAIKGVLLVTLAVMVCSFTDLPSSEGWQQSYTIPYFELLAQIVMPYLPYGGAATEDFL